MLESGSDPGLPVASRAPSLLATAPPPLLFLLPALGRTPLPHPTPGLHNCASVLGFQGNLRTLLGCCSGPSSGSSPASAHTPTPEPGGGSPRATQLGPGEGGGRSGPGVCVSDKSPRDSETGQGRAPLCEPAADPSARCCPSSRALPAWRDPPSTSDPAPSACVSSGALRVWAPPSSAVSAPQRQCGQRTRVPLRRLGTLGATHPPELG